MRKTNGRSFRTLEKEIKKVAFRKFRKNIAEEYANSEAKFARTFFMKKYDLSQDCFYKILDTTVIECLVDYKTINKMETKALLNQKEHHQEAGLSTKKHYAELKVKRKEYMSTLENSDKVYLVKEIEELATEFAYSQLSKAEFAKAYGMSTELLDRLLQKAIVEMIIDDIVFNAIRERSIENTSEDKKDLTRSYFLGLIKKRNSKLHELLSK